MNKKARCAIVFEHRRGQSPCRISYSLTQPPASHIYIESMDEHSTPYRLFPRIGLFLLPFSSYLYIIHKSENYNECDKSFSEQSELIHLKPHPFCTVAEFYYVTPILHSAENESGDVALSYGPRATD